jgi:hypothetical protein
MRAHALRLEIDAWIARVASFHGHRKQRIGFCAAPGLHQRAREVDLVHLIPVAAEIDRALQAFGGTPRLPGRELGERFEVQRGLLLGAIRILRRQRVHADLRGGLCNGGQVTARDLEQTAHVQIASGHAASGRFFHGFLRQPACSACVAGTQRVRRPQ